MPPITSLPTSPCSVFGADASVTRLWLLLPGTDCTFYAAHNRIRMVCTD